MNFTVPLALFGWPLVALVLCARFPVRRAVVAAYVAAWLFLPVYRYEIAGLPDWTKTSATSLSLLLGVALFDFRRLASFRPRWFDAPMIAWCLSPIATSLSNDLGLYDGVAISLDHTVTWGIPYLLGRLYFSDVESLRDVALGLFIGALVYIPFCLWEVRMSPQLHRTVYGFHAQHFVHSHRFGGFRPSVFMEHGLMVGLWMSMATLSGLWLWLSGGLRTLWGYRVPWFLVALAGTAVLCKSTGALVLLAGGALLLLWTRRFHKRWPLVALAFVVPLYLFVRISEIWSGEDLVEAARLISEDRAGSLETRLVNEDLLADKALKRPVFGWGGWGRFRVSDDTGTDISITDGLWIIEFGQRGFVGLVLMLCVFLMPIYSLVRRIPVREWTRPWGASAAALATIMGLYLIDCVANAMITPVYVLAAGGITGLLGVRGAPARAEDVSGSSPGSSEYPDPPSGPPRPGP